MPEITVEAFDEADAMEKAEEKWERLYGVKATAQDAERYMVLEGKDIDRYEVTVAT